jgi:hypothetical protein
MCLDLISFFIFFAGLLVSGVPWYIGTTSTSDVRLSLLLVMALLFLLVDSALLQCWYVMDWALS